MKLIILILFSSPLFAQSIMCQAPITISGINCCTERISQKLCQEIINTYLTDEDLDRIKRVQKDIEAKRTITRHYYPNCFWNATATIIPNFFEVDRFVSSYEMEDILEEHFYRIQESELKAYDLIEFYEYAKVKHFEDVGKYVWQPIEAPAHTAVFLENGIIFQKENFKNSTFNIDRLDTTYKTLHKLYNKSKHKRTSELELRYHRKN